jgi:hypothetical protein
VVLVEWRILRCARDLERLQPHAHHVDVVGRVHLERLCRITDVGVDGRIPRVRWHRLRAVLAREVLVNAH